MDLKTQVIILRKHSEYLTQLSTQLSALLTTTEQALAEPQSVRLASPPGGIGQIADVVRVFSKEAEVFCGRITLFLETKQQTNDTQGTQKTE